MAFTLVSNDLLKRLGAQLEVVVPAGVTMSHDSDVGLFPRGALHGDVLAAGLGAAEALNGNAGHHVIVIVKSAAGAELLRRTVHGDGAGDVGDVDGVGGRVRWDGEGEGEDGENVGELGEHHDDRLFWCCYVWLWLWGSAPGSLCDKGRADWVRLTVWLARCKAKFAGSSRVLWTVVRSKRMKREKGCEVKRLSYISRRVVLSRRGFTETRTSTFTTWRHLAGVKHVPIQTSTTDSVTVWSVGSCLIVFAPGCR